MDKYEYKIRAEEINSLIEQQEYTQAVKIADTIDWRRVRSSAMLCKISELYRKNRRYEDSKEVLLLAYDQHPQSSIYKKIIYSLCDISIKLEEIVQAVEYYKEFVQVAPKDTGRFILQYRLYEAQDVSLEERIAVLEEYKKRDYQEKWAYELAYLYHRIGLATRCIEECDEIILWFGDGKYVLKAMELKMLHAPLTLQQQEKYNARFLSEMEAIAAVEEELLAQQEVTPSMPIEIKSVEVTKAKTARIPSKEIQQEAQEAEQAQTREIPSVETPEDAQAVDPTLEELVALVDEIGDPDLEEETPLEDMPEEELEGSAQEVSDEEDADMKIVPSKDDLDIQIKTIDVDNQYSTINLQEALAKDLAKLFAEEDMGQADATRALPVDTLEIASKLMDRQEAKLEEEREGAFGEVSDEVSDEEEMTTNESIEDGNEMTSGDVTEEKAADEDLKEEEEDASGDVTEDEITADESIKEEEEKLFGEELSQVIHTEPEGDVDDLTILLPPMDLTLGQLSDSPKQGGEEENASQEEIEVFFEEEPEEVTGETSEELAEEDKQEEAEETGEELTGESEQEETEETGEELAGEIEQQEEAEEIGEELTGEIEQQEEAEETGEELAGEIEQQEETEETGEETSQEEETDDSEQPSEDISVPERKEAVEEEKTIAPPIYEGTGVQMSEEMLEQFRQMTIEAAKQAAMVAAAQAAKEAAAQAAKEAAAQAAEQTASAIQASVPDMLLQQEQPAQQEQPKDEAISEQVAENREMPAISQTVEEEEENEEDKQITGQLSFADIMSGWEKTKKDNEEKHIEEMKQKLLDQTGPIFPQTNTAMNAQNELSMISPMLDVFSETEDLANEVEKALEEETELSNALGTSDSSQAPIPSEEIEEIEEIETKDTIEITETTDITDTSDNSEITDASDASKEVEAVDDAQNASAHTTEDESHPADSISSVFDTAEINGLEEKLIGSLSNQHYETANIQIEALSEEMAVAQEQEKAAAEELQEKPDDVQDKAEAEGEKAETSSEENHAEGMNSQEAADVPLGAQEESETEKEAKKGEETAQEARTLTKEEKELFGFLAQTKQLQQNLAIALDAISMVPHTGNVMVMAEEGVGALDIAKLIPEYLAKTKSGFTGKTGVFSFEELKSKDIINMVNEYANGAIIIDRAGELSQQAIVTFTNAMRSLTDKGLVVILVDTPTGIEKCKAVFARLSEIFTVEMNINSLDIDGLVKYGKEYARQLDYSIDAMGVLALYNRIEEKQTIDHAVTIDEVKEIVNGAIEKAEKKSLSGFMDIVFGKRYDKESMVLLKEKDFLVDNK